MNRQLKEKLFEALSSVLPITAIVLLLSITVAPLPSGTMVLFLFGAFLLIVGMGFFSLGADMAMIPLGDGIGVEMSKAKHFIVPVLIGFFLGAVVTCAEPDLSVLARQVPAIPDLVLILSVSAGVGVFMMAALLRIYFQIPLYKLLLILYGCIFVLAFFAPEGFIPISFDAGGVTTGPITVPFIMAFGIGMATLRSDKNSQEDSFGLVALCSIGPILLVMLLGIFFRPSEAAYAPIEIGNSGTTMEAAKEFLHAFPDFFREVSAALLPILLMAVLFELICRRYKKRQLVKIFGGLLYTYLGLVLFLTGVNIGFMPAGHYLGAAIGGGRGRLLLIPIGMLMGYFIVAAEPAVHVLNKQVEEVSNGSITARSMRMALSIGVSVSVGLSMLRILTGISILWFVSIGYAFSLALTFFVPKIYTGIAFDSGGVASGPMTATFLLPFAMGACEACGGNILTDAFGIVAMVAMTPLVTIQLLGLTGELKRRAQVQMARAQFEAVEDTVLYFED